MNQYAKTQSLTMSTTDFLDQSSQDELSEKLFEMQENCQYTTSSQDQGDRTASSTASKLVSKTIKKEFAIKRSSSNARKYPKTQKIYQQESKKLRKTASRRSSKEQMDYTIEYIPLTPSPNYDSSEEEDVVGGQESEVSSTEKSPSWDNDFQLESNSWSLKLKQSMMRLKDLETQDISRYLCCDRFQLTSLTVPEAKFSVERKPETISNYFPENILPCHYLKLLNTFHPMCQFNNTLDQILFSQAQAELSRQRSLVALEDASVAQNIDYNNSYDIKMKTHYYQV